MLTQRHCSARCGAATSSHLRSHAPAPVVRWHTSIAERRQQRVAIPRAAERGPIGPADGGAGSAQTRPNPLLPALRPQVYLQFCQVSNKQVITRTKGKNLGTVRNFWVDPRSGRVVSFDLDEKKSLTSTRIANIPLSSLRQIGDVVLVNDDDAASQQPYDDRYGFVALIGMGVRTRSGTYLGKVS
jgi:sporulation protein YlmC with PRC-barrel domain